MSQSGSPHPEDAPGFAGPDRRAPDAPDRRDPLRQRPLQTGRRKTDPNLTPTEIAAQLGLPPDKGRRFVVQEILAGRLEGHGIVREAMRTLYFASQKAVDDYRATYVWSGKQIALARRKRVVNGTGGTDLNR